MISNNLKAELKEMARDMFIGVPALILVIYLFGDFFITNSTFSILIFALFFINYVIILLHERKYNKNFPYKPYKSKKGVIERSFIGLWAGVHYLFFIGTYDHKRYNTQTDYPETLECVFGNISQAILLFVYIFFSIKLFESFDYYSLFFMIIPIITNIISLKKY